MVQQPTPRHPSRVWRTRTGRAGIASLACLSLVAVAPAPAQALPSAPTAPVTTTNAGRERVQRFTEKHPVAVGSGGAVSSVDPEATEAGLKVLRRGGNAVDAAVATAAALGVTEPYSAGIGGGGYFVYYNARTGRISTLDGRETAPESIDPDAFLDPGPASPIP